MRVIELGRQLTTLRVFFLFMIGEGVRLYRHRSNHCTRIYRQITTHANKTPPKTFIYFWSNIHPHHHHNLLLQTSSKHNKQSNNQNQFHSHAQHASLPRTKRRISNTQPARSLTNPLHPTCRHLLFLPNAHLKLFRRRVLFLAL